MLELDGIEKRFGRRQPPVLAGVDLRAAAGAITVVQGRSGGGKTTLLRIAAGLESPSRGSVRLDGTDVTGVPPERRDVALAFQSLVVYPHLSVAGNVRMAAEAGGLRGGPRSAAIDAALVAAGVAELADRRPGAMSGGQLQRLALARMLARRPRLCLLDEPLAHLDPPARLGLRELLVDLRGEERIVLLVTHDAGEAMRLADHLVVLASGDGTGGGEDHGTSTVVAAGSPAALAGLPPSIGVADATGLDPLNLIAAAAALAAPAPGAASDAASDAARARAPAGAIHLGVRPECVAWSRASAGATGLEAEVRAVRPVPGGLEIVADVPGPRPFRLRTPAGEAAPPPPPGERIRCTWPSAAAWWFDAAGRRVDGQPGAHAAEPGGPHRAAHPS